MGTRGRLLALPGAQQTPGWLTVEQAADRLGCSRRTVFRLLNARAIASIKVGRRRHLAATDVDRYIDQLRGEWLEQPTP